MKVAYLTPINILLIGIFASPLLKERGRKTLIIQVSLMGEVDIIEKIFEEFQALQKFI